MHARYTLRLRRKHPQKLLYGIEVVSHMYVTATLIRLLYYFMHVLYTAFYQ